MPPEYQKVVDEIYVALEISVRRPALNAALDVFLAEVVAGGRGANDKFRIVWQLVQAEMVVLRAAVFSPERLRVDR